MNKPIYIGFFLACVYLLVLISTQCVHLFHYLFFGLFFFAYFFHHKTRYYLLLALPFFLKNLIYDALRWIPFDFIKPIHVTGPYFLEKALFSVMTSGGKVLLIDYLTTFRNEILDIYLGSLYALIDLYPILTILILWKWRGEGMAWRFSTAHFVMNLFSFVTYIFYPVAPPWYVQQYGLIAPLVPVPGSAAGLQWLEKLFGTSAISTAYHLNPIVFGAIPSMHVGYACCISFYLATLLPKRRWWLLALYVLSISFGALYLGHHYVIDIILGAGYALGAILLCEAVLKGYFQRLFSLLKPSFVPDSFPLLLGKNLPHFTLPPFPLLLQREQGREEEQ